jgi:hypothetical protein
MAWRSCSTTFFCLYIGHAFGWPKPLCQQDSRVVQKQPIRDETVEGKANLYAGLRAPRNVQVVIGARLRMREKKR